MKTKKNKNKKGHYEVQYLAAVIVIFLLVEVALFSVAGQADWQAGASMLDMSGAVENVVSDLGVIFQPVTQTISDLNLFYQSAATAMTQLLDMSQTDFFGPLNIVLTGVNDFYQQAATQMAEVLDFSPNFGAQPQVAGITITVR